MEWKPIESAPRDRPIIGRNKDIRAVAMEWDVKHGLWFRDNVGTKHKVSICPTQWIPLPPEEAEGVDAGGEQGTAKP